MAHVRTKTPLKSPNDCIESTALDIVSVPMGEGFIFEAPSDEEAIYSEVDTGDEELEEDELPTSHRRTESPWEFGSYYGSVDEEHARRNTTSIDSKITKALKQRSLPFDSSVVDDNESVESESNGQENFIPEEEEDDDDGEVACDAGDKQSFYEYLDGAVLHANSFMELHLSRPLLRACESLGYLKPTPIQATCIPLAISGRDICGSAITGSGKTAAYTLPTLERLYNAPKRSRAIRALILTPTRELAVQVHSMIEKLAQFTDIRCCLILGGVSIKTQEAALRSMPDIVVATPGRMIDHLQNSMSVDLDDLAILILDEADRLLEDNFAMETERLVSLCPRNRQTMLFSATMTDKVNELIKLSLTNPLRLSVDPSMKRPAALTEEIVRIRRMREANQESVLFALCSKTYTSKVIIFSKTKQEAHRLKILFGLTGFKAAELHGNLTQVQRLDALELFRNQQVDFLIATDVAARGLDIKGVQTVINYACPRNLTSYTHRVGRTARIGRKGHAVTFVLDDDRSLLKSIAKKAGAKLKSRNVAEQSITKWSQIIEQMEDQVKEILQEEREERALRKVEMEVTKAENMIAHKEEIFSRPKRTWFVTEKEKRLVAKATKESLEKANKSGKEILSAGAAEDLKAKEKRKREREKNLPRRKRRKLEAAREMLEENKIGDMGGSGKNEEKYGMSVVDLAYRRAKAAKAAKKAVDSGKIVRKVSESKHHSKRTKSRPEEMRELFQSDMNDRKQKRNGSSAGRKKSKNSFKSKSRYKRR